MLIFSERRLRQTITEYDLHYNGRPPIAATSPAPPGPARCSAASSMNTSSHIEGPVKASGRVLAPHRLAATPSAAAS